MKQSNFSQMRLLIFLNLLFIGLVSTVYSQQNTGPILISKLNFVQKAQQTFIGQPSQLSFDIILGNNDQLNDLSINYSFVDTNFGIVRTTTGQEITAPVSALTTNEVQVTTLAEGKSALLIELKKDDQLIDTGLIQLTSYQSLFVLKGTDVFCIQISEDYVEPGFEVTDATEGDLSDQVIIDNSSLNTNAVGEYLITYTLAIDGKTQILNRLVKVIDTDEDIFGIDANDAGNESFILLNEFDFNFNTLGVTNATIFVYANNTITEDLGIKLTIENTEIAEIISITDNTTDNSLSSNIGTIEVGVKGKILGNTKLLVTAPNGISYEHIITVSRRKSACFTNTNKNIAVGERFRLSLDVRDGFDGEVGPLEITVGDEGVLSYNEISGMITGIATGVSSIEVTDLSSGYTKTMDIEVNAPEVEVDTVTIDQGESLTLITNENTQLTATVLPENANGKAITWTSSDTSVIIVDELSGEINTLQSGTAVITATSVGNTNATDQIEIIVNNLIDSIEITPNGVNLEVGTSQSLVATILPVSAPDTTVTWSSNDDSIISIDANGLITANKAGSAIIRATSNLDASLFDEITVNATIAVNEILISPVETSFDVGETVNFNAQVLPANATNKSIVWSSSDTSIASINANGVATILKAGDATITATSVSNPSIFGTAPVFAIVRVTSVSLSPATATIEIGEDVILNASVLPSDASRKGLMWNISNTNIVTTSSLGNSRIFTGLSVGTATITITSIDNPSITATTQISVIEPFIPVERIVISGANNDDLLGTGETLQLTATVLPANATNKNITWRNRNDDTSIPARARVNASGLVTGIAQSTTNIIAASASNPSVTASVKIRVFTTPPILEGDGDYFGKPRETVRVTIQATGQETEITGIPVQAPGSRIVRSSGVVIFESAQARDIRPSQVGYLREEVRYNGDATTSETFTYQLPGNGFRPLRVRIVPDVNNNVSFPGQDTATISVTSNGVTRTRNLSSNTNPSFGRF